MKKTFTFPTRLDGKNLAGILVFWVCLGMLYFSPAHAGPLIVGMGDSIGEGVQSADANLRTQPFSYLNFITGQMGVHFPLPWIRSSPVGVIGDTTFRYPQGKDPKMASQWYKWDAIGAFKDMFGLRIFQKSLAQYIELDGFIHEEVDRLGIGSIEEE